MSTNGANPHAPDHCVRVRGARENNLRDVEVAIPRNALAVFTGVSGSGKSSLAFGTIYAEAQRRYFESVAPYARRLLQHFPTEAGVLDNVAHWHMGLGRPREAAELLQRELATGRALPGAEAALSECLRALQAEQTKPPAPPAAAGAEGGTRTPTVLLQLDPESSAAANSATSARKGWGL